MLPYGRQSISEDDIEAVVKVLRGDWLTTGPAVSAFERALSEISGGHEVVSTTSGTAALHTAYKAMGVEPGDEVITTPMTFIATASCASILGARVRFADIDLETGLIDPESVEHNVTARTKVVAAVDYAGQPADYPKLNKVASDAGALMLADAAHSIGSSLDGRPVGDLADVTALSFFPTKNMTTGEGGAIVFKDERLASRAREFHNIGLVRDPARFQIVDEGPWHQEVHELGLNYRLTDLACALGIAQLKQLSAFKRRRSEIVLRYNEALNQLDGVVTPKEVSGADSMRHLYPLRVLDGRRREMFEVLRSQGIGVQVNYIPVYWHPVYADQGYRPGLCPNAEKFYSEELSLPLFPSLTNSQVDEVIERVVSFF